ncbi:MAG: ATP-binding protein [Pseudomonadota bacterium]
MIALSINARLLISSSLVLALFFGTTSVILDNAFRSYTKVEIRDRLQRHTLRLIATADVNDSGDITVAQAFNEPRFLQHESGLYARIVSHNGRHRWRSGSVSKRILLPPAPLLKPAAIHFGSWPNKSPSLFVFGFGVSWDQHNPPQSFYTVTVAESTEAYNEQVSNFRQFLGLLLGGVSIIFLLIQFLMLRWGMAPLRTAASELSDIESGKKTGLTGNYPHELRGLTRNLNALMSSSRQRMERYRHSLSDLAHSLKTPLAVLQNLTQPGHDEESVRSVLREQVERMSRTIEYQLQRAGTAGRMALTASVAVAPIVEKIMRSLDKVYVQKKVYTELNIDMGAVFDGVEGDLVELLGNLLDNAYKCCRKRVAISMRIVSGAHGNQQEFLIEDDGDGIPERYIRAVLQRGVRLDNQLAEGQGIGLAVVKDIVDVYGGELQIATSPMGGAAIYVRFPMARLSDQVT